MSTAFGREFDVSTGRKAPGYYQLKKVRHIHKRIRDMAFLGHKDVQIADQLGVTTQMVKYTRESVLVKNQLGIMEGAAQANAVEIAKEIQELAPYALRTLETIMLNPTTKDTLRAKLASDLLDRAGHTAVKRMQVQKAPMSNTDALNEIKKRAAGILSQGAVDATVVDDQEVGEVN